MKRIALFVMALIAVIACNQEDPQVTPELNVLTDAALVIPTEGGEVSVDFESNVDWTATLKEAAAADWCTVTPASGVAGQATVKVIAIENTGTDNRTVTVVLTAGTVVKEVAVSQLQKDALTVGEKSFELPADGGQVKVAVAHNLEIEATPSVEWITKAESKAMVETELVFDVAANTGAAREGKITVKAGALKEEIVVKQAAWVPVFEVAPTEDQWIALEGGSVELTVNANVEYTVAAAENDWLTITNEGSVYTLTAGANTGFDYRSVAVSVTPKDEAYAESAVSFYVFQSGRAAKLWSLEVTDIEGYDPTQKVRLAKYGDYIAVANTTKVFALDPQTGEIALTINMPEGVAAQSVLVDDAGNFLIAADAGMNADMTLFYVPDPMNPQPEVLLTYNTGNYYGSLETGNIRVKGNIKGNALITATVAGSCNADGTLNTETGAVIYWEVVDGVCSDWNWTNVPYTAWGTSTLCAAPAGASIADGLFYIGYGGDYNLQYAADVAKGAGTTWAVSYVTGSSWMENYNCIATAEWNGGKYAAIVMGCHFNYDAADAVLLDVNDPAAAKHVYTHHGDGDAAWDWEAGVNGSWTDGGTFSDVLLIPTEDALLMVYVDSRYGTMACVAIR